ncbi:ubiquitin hydrolase, putative,cysteine peptidase, Clan CA, family C19 [Trypanosoma cruzi]|nr:ubiquitin hydrolase, putative,cysteine peptidase, Clan CA, family C19 [Trypanosoma cruzi]
MAGGVPVSTIPQHIPTGERRRVNTYASLGDVGRPRPPRSVTLPLLSPASERVSGSNEEDPGFLEFDVTTWVPRIWNEGAPGILFETRSAYDCWHRGDAHAQIAFDFLVSWMRASRLHREHAKQFMDSGRVIPRAFRMLIVIKSDPSVPTQRAARPPSQGLS